MKIEKGKQKLSLKLVTGIDNLTMSDKHEIVKEMLLVAQSSKPDSDAILNEISNYNIELPDNDNVDLGGISKLFAIAQSYETRVSNIEMRIVACANIWKQLCNFMHAIIVDLKWDIDDLSCRAIIEPNIKELKNSQLQQATVRKQLSNEHKRLHNAEKSFVNFKSVLSDIEGLQEVVGIKKRNLVSTLTNLNRQLKILQLDATIT